MARPTSRIAKTVNVFATAHSAPARIAQTMRCFLANKIGKDVTGSLEQGREGPARGKDAGDHAQRDGERREAGVDQLGRGLGSSQPDARGETADHSQPMKRAARCCRLSPLPRCLLPSGLFSLVTNAAANQVSSKF